MLSAIIGKMKIKTCRDFGSSGILTTLEVVCENDFMAAYSNDPDRCFTKYSPWGEATIAKTLLSGPTEGFRGHQFYVVTTLREDNHLCPGASLVVNARCHSILDLGDNQAKTVEVCQSYQKEPVGFNMKTAIDNPPAVEFFKPGQDIYRVAFYDAELFSREQALADALGTPAEVEE